MQTNTFWLKFDGLSLAVTLKIRSKSPKPIQLFIESKCYIHANLIKIRQLVHEMLYVGAIIESDARPTGVQLKREAKLLTVIGLNTKHADCRIIFMLYPIRL